MDQIIVTGNGPLHGAIPIAGAKNACLTLMPATLLSEEPLTLTNAPRLSDIRTMTTLLQSLGAEVTALQEGKVLALSSHGIDNFKADYDIVRKMRASILVLGPMLARFGEAVVSLPGGCAIGARPVDLHLRALEAMGAELDLRDGYVHARAKGGLKGGTFEFPLVSVGATENAVMAATLAKGTTVLKNAAREPEIVDLVHCLRKMGAQIEGEGTSTLTIQGVDRLSGATHRSDGPRVLLRRETGRGRGGGHGNPDRPAGSSPRRPGQGGQRDDRTVPRLSDRPAGTNDGAALHGGWHIGSGRADF